MVKRILKHPFPLFFVLALLGYSLAEFLIRGEMLNKVSFGVGGYIFYILLALLFIRVLIVPFISFVFFPEWKEPEEMKDPSERLHYLEKYGKFLVERYYQKKSAKNPPEEIAGDIKKLKGMLEPDDPGRKLKKLEPLITSIHSSLSEKVCDKILKDYMKKAAILVAISRRGWLDSLAMLIMQIRMVIDVSKTLGYRPSWIFILYCLGWILVNSLLFSLFDESGHTEKSSFVNPFEIIKEFKILAGIGIQMVSSMALIYATGKIVQRRLLGQSEKLPREERIEYRKTGYKEAMKLISELGFKDFVDIFSSVKERFSQSNESVHLKVENSSNDTISPCKQD